MTEGGPISASRQQRILEATVSLLLEVGLRAATTRAVTEKADVGTGLLNHYFRWPDLRALAWAHIFDAVTKDQFSPGADPQTAIDNYFASAFDSQAHRFWKLWVEAADIAMTDSAMSEAFLRVRSQMRSALHDVLISGCNADCWQLPDSEATAVRLGALYDGLAAALLSPSPEITAAEAEAHLRHLFQLECRA